MRATRRTNLGLLATLSLALGTGILAYGVGTGQVTWIVLAHGALGLAAVLLAPWKSVIVGRSWPRAGATRWLSVLLGVVAATTVVTGVVHATGTRHLGPLTAMQVHVGAAVTLIPLLMWHVWTRPAPVRSSDLSRRNLLRAGGLLATGVTVWGAIEELLEAVGARGADRRGTGSLEVGSYDPDAMPITQWFDDRVPVIDGDTWRLTIVDGGGRRELDRGALTDGRRDLVATLDCTGGWYAEQRWAGIRLAELLEVPDGARSVHAVSVTGYSRRFPLRDLPHLLVATAVDGAPLSAGHGFPARIVAPGRRGFWWVKWLDRVEVSRRPWWLQSPFPLT